MLVGRAPKAQQPRAGECDSLCNAGPTLAKTNKIIGNVAGGPTNVGV